ncbi:hypothetical protein DPMN_143664 [Dreissena polymorpha]|uniref:Uncharacterized protein n=1 Tax=Dreissena polymorpha TaxID=45954 RepID=A0A9D4GGS4_DREPO|nr:hypothetical protein DPMN_143664 [Dreissena polymorpha]
MSLTLAILLRKTSSFRNFGEGYNTFSNSSGQCGKANIFPKMLFDKRGIDINDIDSPRMQLPLVLVVKVT